VTDPSPVRILARRISRDGIRILLSLLGAYLLWYFIGRKVETEEGVFVTISAQALDDSVRPGLVIRVPPGLVVEEYAPRRLNLDVRATKEEIDRLKSGFIGIWNLPPDFCGTKQRVTRQVDVGTVFTIAGERSLASMLTGAVPFEVTVAQRETYRIPLSRDTVVVEGATLPADASWEFQPSSVEISGARDVIGRIRGGGARIRIEMSREEFNQALQAPQRIGGRSFSVVEANGAPRGSVVFNEPRFVEMKLGRVAAQRAVLLDEVEVNYLIPTKAWREGVDRENPVRLSPERITAEIAVPSDYVAVGELSDDLRAKLRLHVDLLDMPASVEAAPLPVRVVGLPPGITVKLIPERVDVEWRKSP
jgi:hypothetical protein